MPVSELPQAETLIQQLSVLLAQQSKLLEAPLDGIDLYLYELRAEQVRIIIGTFAGERQSEAETLALCISHARTQSPGAPARQPAFAMKAEGLIRFFRGTQHTLRRIIDRFSKARTSQPHTPRRF